MRSQKEPVRSRFLSVTLCVNYFCCIDAEKVASSTDPHKINSKIAAITSLHTDTPGSRENLANTKAENTEEVLGTKPKHGLSATIPQGM